MKTGNLIRTLFLCILLGSNLGCDRISKNAVRESVNYFERISLIENYVTLTKVENSGAFLSMGTSLPEPVKFILLTILPLALLAFAFVFMITRINQSIAIRVGLAFMLGGGFGNLYDRVIYGSVTDFLHIDFILFQTGIFNLADVSIMIGMFIILLDLLMMKNGKEVSLE